MTSPDEIKTQYARNQTFSYPDKNVRFLDAQRRLDENSGSPVVNGQATDARSFAIQRGYIKNLQPATLSNAPLLSTCYFQFNPQEIRQRVEMREDIYNPVLLTPEQLSQPIGGNVSFQFDLLFDRSRELASRKGRSGLVMEENLGLEDMRNDPRDKGPEKIGVYADLKVLYNIIGQGLSDGTIDLQLQSLKNTYNAKVARENAYSSGTEEPDTTTTPAPTEESGDPFSRDFTDQQALVSLFESNIGNAAFLLPNPVRIVFSPLLMVDGFVTGTNVDFLKFNSQMIPMQCRVALSVNALYIGFAKKKTFLTTTIESGRESLREEYATDTAAIAPINNAVLNSAVINPFRMGFGHGLLTSGQNFSVPGWDSALKANNVSGNILYVYLLPNDVATAGNVFRFAYTGFPNIQPIAGEKNDIDPVLKLFEDPNTSFNINYSWGFKIYGSASQNQNNGVGWTESIAKTVLAGGGYKDGGSAVLVGNYYGTETASSKEEWGSGVSGSGNERNRIRRRSYHGNQELSNNNSYNLDFSSGIRQTNIMASYYIVTQTFQMTLTLGSITYNYVMDDENKFRAVIRGSGKNGIDPASQSAANTTTVRFIQSK